MPEVLETRPSCFKGLFCLSIVSTRDDERQRVVKGGPVDAAVVALEHVLHSRIIAAKKIFHLWGGNSRGCLARCLIRNNEFSLKAERQRSCLRYASRIVTETQRSTTALLHEAALPTACNWASLKVVSSFTLTFGIAFPSLLESEPPGPPAPGSAEGAIESRSFSSGVTVLGSVFLRNPAMSHTRTVWSSEADSTRSSFWWNWAHMT